MPPAGVHACASPPATTSKVERQLFSVIPGQDTRLLVTGLPSGAVTFNGDAFDLACSAVNGKSFPTWISDSQTVTLSPSIVAKVFLTFRQHPGSGLVRLRR